jgi:AcrR family transcriptional regulator
MPRISASSIRAHVSRQREQLLDAATVLFRQKGYRATEFADIARAIGLARNSLYRYYPDKEHLLLACVQRDMEPLLKRFEQLEHAFREPRARIDAWLELSLAFATGPAHATLQVISEIRESAPDLREEIMKIHQAPTRVLEAAVREALGRQERDPAVVGAMIAGMTQSAAGLALRRGNGPAVRRELSGAVRRLLDA